MHPSNRLLSKLSGCPTALSMSSAFASLTVTRRARELTVNICRHSSPTSVLNASPPNATFCSFAFLARKQYANLHAVEQKRPCFLTQFWHLLLFRLMGAHSQVILKLRGIINEVVSIPMRSYHLAGENIRLFLPFSCGHSTFHFSQ